MEDELIPMELSDALEKHLEMHAIEYREATVDSHDRRMSRFVDWCEEQDIKETTDVTRRHLKDWYLHRMQETGSKYTVKSDMDTLRVMIRNLEDYDAFPNGFHQLVPEPDMKDEEPEQVEFIEIERGHEIRDYLRKYQYASHLHVLYECIWSSAMRIGAAHSIDLGDVLFEEDKIRLRHRPKTGTTLKNGKSGERTVAVHPKVMEAIEDFIDRNRPETTDEHGRRPLFASPQGGRYHKETLRSHIYAATRPCFITGNCPVEGKDVESCDAADDRQLAYECPESLSPHPIRKGAITRMRKADIPRSLISDRVDASEEVIEETYNKMTEEEKADLRSDHFDDEYESYEA